MLTDFFLIFDEKPIRMKKLNLLLFTVLYLSTGIKAQNIQGTEIGLDGFFSASTNGGNFSLGAKYGLNFADNFIGGPSVRYQRSWNKNVFTNQQSSYNVYGAGGFIHARFFDVLFAGAELEFLKTPLGTFGTLGQKSWITTCFIGGGYSQEFNESWRLNVGIMYDVVNSVNSPFRQGYFLKKENGALIPVIYRIAFFFPIS